jgi:hypothetical protein
MRACQKAPSRIDLQNKCQEWFVTCSTPARSIVMESVLPGSEYAESRSSENLGRNEAHWSGVSWGAVIGGAFVAAALSLILLALGAGLGLSAVSPWSSTGASATVLGTSAIIWLILVEVIASALGGYLTGRLRTKWALVHSDEVYFRDTANGFLSWAVALVISVSLLASAGASMVGRSSELRSSGSNSVASASTNPNAYFVDTLFRSDRSASKNSVSTDNDANSDIEARAEAYRIIEHALVVDQIPAADQRYLVRMVVAHTGVSEPEAEQRVTTVIENARQAADAARKISARLLLWFFLALLMGAFSASYAATIGGRQRDHVKSV